MKTDDLIAGLTILAPYYDNPGGYNCGAEHDVIYAYATDKPVADADVAKLKAMGWTQDDAEQSPDDDDDFVYDPESSWSALV